MSIQIWSFADNVQLTPPLYFIIVIISKIQMLKVIDKV